MGEVKDRFLRDLFGNDRGQDLAEYCLLMAFVALVALGIIIHASGGIQAVWTSANTTMAAHAPAAAAGGDAAADRTTR